MAMPGDCPWKPGDQAYRCSENGQGEGARVGSRRCPVVSLDVVLPIFRAA